jgi:hypothetical protein
MSAPITEAHRAIAEKLGDLLDIEQMTGPSPAEQAAQLIADSEAAAVQIAMIREYGNLCATNEGLAKERDQLRADCENETKWAAHYLADAQNARARAERAEAELAAERARLDDLLSINATGAARLAHATAQLKAEREKVRVLRAELTNIAAANPAHWGDEMDQFMPWAQNRARHTLIATEDTP